MRNMRNIGNMSYYESSVDNVNCVEADLCGHPYLNQP